MSKKKKKQPRDDHWDIANATTQDFKPFVYAPQTTVNPGPREKQAEPKLDKND